ncbi:apidaecins type 73-like isoform X5 [Leptopilina boulardi]|uniref:apidaecins type 73-like isoform X4 n=1 Tax=Leptopilina boulardi TaxID=63433 RepID=UPI0021F5D047|nr:apidaecins type 73-like isoform X4 [Leptopilina boulardi]XP_051165159.1 apidaecins type 73-like isoform X5 [Leptopilina boulardi]
MAKTTGALIVVALFAFAVLASHAEPQERVRREPGRPGNMPRPRPIPIRPRPPHPRLRREAEEKKALENFEVAEETLSTLERVRREPGKPGNMPKPRPIPIKPRPPHPRLRREAEEEEEKNFEEAEESLSTLERVRREPGKPGNMPRPRPIPIRPRPPHPRLRREAEEEDEALENFDEAEESLNTLERVRREPGKPGNMPRPRPIPIRPRPPHPRLRREAEEEEKDEEFKSFVDEEESLLALERVRREPGRPGNMPRPRPIPIRPRPPHPRL